MHLDASDEKRFRDKIDAPPTTPATCGLSRKAPRVDPVLFELLRELARLGDRELSATLKSGHIVEGGMLASSARLGRRVI